MSDCNYLKNSSLFATGFLSNTAKLRIKQGLAPQELSNQCQFVEPGSKKMSDMERAGGVCNNKFLYPFYAPQVNYGPVGHIPTKCACTMFIQPP